MNKVLKKILLVIALIPVLNTGFGQGFLKTNAQRIVNEKGENVLLRGMGLGGWMLQEGYMLGVYSQGQQHVIRQKITDLTGTDETDMFYDMWLKNHTRKIDIDSLRAWGFNSVRLPMHYNLYTLPSEEEPVPGTHTWLERGFAMTDSLLAWCKANQLYLILDLHAAPGGQGNDFNISDRDPSKPSLWASRANQEKTIALWQKLAERYANEPWIGAYDILNEPNFGFMDPTGDPNGLKEQKNEPLKRLYLEITEAIRKVDRKHIIIIEGNGWGNNYNGMLPVWDDNMVISYHKYWNYNDEASIAHMLKTRSEQNVPVWLGETGENSNVWFTSCIALLERNNIGWAMWPLKKLGANNPLQVRTNPDYEAVLNYWRNNGPQPSREHAIRGFVKLAVDLKLENNIVHRDVIDAMIRQPHSNATKPFKRHKPGQFVSAVDYDLGRINKAYYDLDSANFRVVQGPQGGNKGRVYRNDGVDIREDSLAAGEYIVFNIEPGEWLQYTVHSPTQKKFNMQLVIKSAVAGEVIQVSVNDHTQSIRSANPSKEKWQTISTKIPLTTGENRIRIKFTQTLIGFRGFTFAP